MSKNTLCHLLMGLPMLNRGKTLDTHEPAPFVRLPGRERPGHSGRRGNATVEFSLVGIAFLTVLFGFINFSHALFARSLLRYAVSQGIRYGVTGQTRTGLSHTESIKAVVQESALGLLQSGANAATIKVRYYLPDGVTETTTVTGNNLLEVAVEDYPLVQLAPLFWSDLTITNRLLDVLEPFAGTGGGAGGGGGGGGACIASS